MKQALLCASPYICSILQRQNITIIPGISKLNKFSFAIAFDLHYIL
jgi:hypothetical protein